MKTLYKNITILHPDSKWDQKKFDILVNDGIIETIDKNISSKANRTIDGDDLYAMPSLVDMQAICGEPGTEYIEDLNSISMAAASGGFSHVCLLPNTEPAIDNAAQIRNVLNHDANNVTLLPYGSMSKGCRGKQLSEMYDMHQSGAAGFTDGKSPVSNANLMKRALEYIKPFDGKLVSYPHDSRVSPGGMINESVNNVSLGIKQTPELAEEIMLNRDIYLLEYTGSKMHVSNVSTLGSIRLVEDAKNKGLKITAGVSMHNLVYTEERLNDFDTNFKTQPALRSEETRLALIAAVKEGIIDVIVSDHTPQNIEAKDCEFEHALYGMTMLETFLPLANMHLSDLQWNAFVKAASINPRKILNLDEPNLTVGSRFEYSVFSPHEIWSYDSESCRSKSQNSPEFGRELKGRVKN